LDGPLTFTPVTTEAGKRYEITGKVLVGNLVRSEGVPSGTLAVVIADRGAEAIGIPYRLCVVA